MYNKKCNKTRIQVRLSPWEVTRPSWTVAAKALRACPAEPGESFPKLSRMLFHPGPFSGKESHSQDTSPALLMQSTYGHLNDISLTQEMERKWHLGSWGDPGSWRRCTKGGQSLWAWGFRAWRGVMWAVSTSFSGFVSRKAWNRVTTWE